MISDVSLKGFKTKSTMIECSNCNYKIHINSPSFVRDASRHFGSSTHESNTGWKLTKHSSGSFTIQKARSLAHFGTIVQGSSKGQCFSSSYECGTGMSQTHTLNGTSAIGTQTNSVDCSDAAIQVCRVSMQCLKDRGTQTLNTPPCSEEPKEDTVGMILGDLLGIEVTETNIKHLKEYGFVIALMRNILLRGKSPTLVHDEIVASTLGKMALKFSFSAALAVSLLVGGPRRTNLRSLLSPTVRVLPFYSKDNVAKHLKIVQGSLCFPELVLL